MLLQTEIKSIIQEEIWRENLPLSILDEADIKSMIAMAKPRVDTSSLGSLYDKIQLVVDTAGALAEGRMLVMLHITQYCDNGQLLYLHRELLRHHMQLLDLECCRQKSPFDRGKKSVYRWRLCSVLIERSGFSKAIGFRCLSDQRLRPPEGKWM